MRGTHPVPRTRVEQLVRQRRLTTQEFCAEFHAASQRVGRPLAVSERHASRWFSGRLGGLPHPATCRVLEHMFGEPAEVLFGPPQPDPVPGGPEATSSVAAEGGVETATTASWEREIAMAAVESARFGQFAEQTNVGPHTLEQFRADAARIVATYPTRPVYPVFVELRELRNRIFELLEGRQHPRQTRELYLVAGVLCGVLANASFDLGWLAAAETQARTAFLCAELAGNNALRAWIRGTQSLVAYWDERPRMAVDLAVDGWRYLPEAGTARVRLAAIEARAQARLRDRRAAEDALRRAEQARNEVRGEDDPGGMLAFPVAKQTFYSATSRLWLGEQADLVLAEQQAAEAVALYQEDPPEHRRLGELCLARLDLAAARLGRHDLEGAAEQVQEVMVMSGRRRTDSVHRRLRQVANALRRPHYQTSALALDLRDQILTFCGAPTAPALPGGAG
ncbi:hypothetical protein LX15_002739 [Streptoalloteichus tenebrarius]|uniref:XRE family transcriptional regulator n=1 Tax=Streptoalloteichus tenebrarius (strain ATCC 17920 / DSM 40477 / JCM 4838 / CBS 697.72 / NBRC 16177 / NCIMB 11028 / NRRL B-12390 / A12253. 1 / ISP 5477) TaxID=1933 RepID=A0ABT1HU35_STRSD|nr:hypothetical protein [Streptoalloteichus tenebrarius]MCP2259038.1 hypothetical protein [Streptoalloteichus tenebrarius]BFE99637.1 hypothetical protein GCM10020241_13130 [Streptoalloteichus tenebrarius]